MATNTSQANSSPLLSLPAELRNRIYREAFDQDSPVAVTTTTFPEPPLLSTCKQIRNEGSQLFYADRIFQNERRDYDLGPDFLFLQKSEQIYRDFSIDMKEESIRRSANPNRQNMLTSFHCFHRVKGESEEEDSGTKRLWNFAETADELLFAILHMVKGLRELPWAQVEPMVERYHKVLIRIDARWT